MAHKSRSAWSAAYRQRVERAEARAAAAGRPLTAQQARGHRPAEHRTRAANKAAKAVAAAPRRPPPPPPPLTKQEIAYARRIGRDLNKRGQMMEPAEAADTAQAYARRVGIARFREEVRRQQGEAAHYRRNARRGIYHDTMTMAPLDAWAAADGFPEVAWYFYH